MKDKRPSTTRATRAGRTEEEHLEMMGNPRRWPHLILPLKHRSETDASGIPRLALLFASSGASPEFYILRDACLWAYGAKDRPNPADRQPITPGEAIKEGWIVD